MIQQLLKADPETNGNIQHVINTVISDDTDTRMKGFGQGSAPAIHTVCNTVQALHVQRVLSEGAGSEEHWESANIPTPMVVLAGAKTADIHAAMTTMSVVCANGVGKMLKLFGFEPDSVKPPPAAFMTEVMVGDSLKANKAAWKIENSLLALRRAKSGERILALQVKYQVHQLNLIRKPMVLSIPAFWTSLVRLSHLFEQYSFRQSFSASLLQLLQSPGCFQRCLRWTFGMVLNFFIPFRS